LDGSKTETHKDILTRELEAVGIRLNRSPPQIYFKKKKTGGISFSSTARDARRDCLFVCAQVRKPAASDPSCRLCTQVALTHMDEKLVNSIMHGALLRGHPPSSVLLRAALRCTLQRSR
jgi:ribosome-interacting GTPase 1